MKKLASILIVFTLFISGCAHKRHIEAGDQFMQQGKYELAIRAYEEALNSRSRDKETRRKLSVAQNQFDQWLNNIAQLAQQAEANNQREVALLLHAKLANQGNYQSKQAFNQLYSQVRPSIVYHVYLQSQQHIDLAQSIQTHPDLMLANSPVLGSNGSNLSVQLGNAQFSISEKQIVRSGEFLEGYRKEENPDFHALNHDIDRADERIRTLDREWRRADDKVRDQKTNVQLLEKDQEIWTLKLADLPPNSSAALRFKEKLRVLESTTLPDARRDLKKKEKTKLRIDNDLAKQKKKRRKLLERFRHTSPTVEIPVYATLEYPVQVMTKHVSGQLNLNTSTGINKQLVIRSAHTDEGHEAIPLLQLESNPIQLQSDGQMELDYRAQATQDAMLTILSWKDVYRRGLAANALNAQTPDQRTALFVRYLLSGEVSDPAVVAQFKQQLAFIYGQAGEFDIPMILQWR